MQKTLHNSKIGLDLLEIIAGNYGNMSHKFFPIFTKEPDITEAIFTFSGNNENLNGTTCLHHAILYSNLDMVSFLLQEGVSANLPNGAGFKALDFARYQAFTIFNGDDSRSNQMFNLLTTYAEKELLNHSIEENASKKTLKI